MYYLSEIPEYITPDWILSKLNQEDIYRWYLQIDPQIGKKYTNPLRSDDKDPGCSFYWRNNLLWFNDFAYEKVYNCFTIVKELYRLSWNKTLNKIVEDMIVGNLDYKNTKIIREQPIINKEEVDIQVTIQDFTKKDKEYLKSYSLNRSTLNKYHVYSIKHYWIDGDLNYTYRDNDPCLGYYRGNGKWKLYFYNRKSGYRFINNISRSDLQGYEQLPWLGKSLIITKSMKDVMIFDILEEYSVAPHSESIPNTIERLVWRDKLNILIKRFDKIYLNFDNDKAGIQATEKLLKHYPEIIPLYIPIEYECKDISDYVKKFNLNFAKEIIKTIKK